MLPKSVIKEVQNGWFNLIGNDIVSLCEVITFIQKQMTICPFLSSARTTDLLHIVFDAFRHIHMNDTFQIREIESHP